MRLVLAALLIASAPSAFATGVVFSIGAGDGGGNLAHISGGQNYQIEAGRGLQAQFGIVYSVTPMDLHTFELQFDAGFAYAGYSKDGEKNSVSWTRFPLELIYFYRNTRENFRIGYGPVLHVVNELEGKGTTAGASSDFDNAFGWTVVFDKMFGIPQGDGTTVVPPNGGGWAFGLKYNGIRYHSSKFNAGVDGSALLVTLSMMAFF